MLTQISTLRCPAAHLNQRHLRFMAIRSGLALWFMSLKCAHVALANYLYQAASSNSFYDGQCRNSALMCGDMPLRKYSATAKDMYKVRLFKIWCILEFVLFIEWPFFFKVAKRVFVLLSPPTSARHSASVLVANCCLLL